ncbi:serine/threonine-protein kinase [Myxococcus guangdongensis]|uniref:serine/threonine-protein kinase n=1 Tax=Myxococcus guangdongensis TaxID=2906760 RepID=UPI002B21E930|nr:serine/threonine-protein kinase [Myxococcus guangdongensis]
MSTERNQRFGRYELQSLMGRGGMAETWRAKLVGAAGVTKPVLIKMVLPEFANHSDFISRFISEARISSTLSHGNIAQVFEFGRVEGQYFLAMELVDGQPLHRVLKRAARLGLPRLPPSLAAYIALEMCRGLHYAHTRTDEKGAPLGIVHRDISPDNVLISYEGQVKIVDFGIAKARMARDFETQPGVVRGKYLYFSPEQAKGLEVDARSDVWSTGLVLYELLCGQPPVTGTQAAVMLRLAYGEFPPPRQLRPSLPPELDALIMSALSVDLDARYRSAHAFAEGLAEFLYSQTRSFSSQDLAYGVRLLFRDDLQKDGRTLTVPRSFEEEFASWRTSEARARPPPSKPHPRETLELPAAPYPGATPLARNPDLDRTVLDASRFSGEPPTQVLGALGLLSRLWLSRKWRVAGLASLGVLGTVLTGVLIARALPSDSTSTPTEGRDTRPVAGELRPPAVIAYPVRELTLEADRDVIIVPPKFHAFVDLDPSKTYALGDASGPTQEAPEVLAPGADGPTRVFHLLSGDADQLPEANRLGQVPIAPMRFSGARSVALFRLGPPSPRSTPWRNIRLAGRTREAFQAMTFDPDAEGLLLKRALTLTGLDPMVTYALTLEATEQDALLHGPKAGPARTVICAQWVPDAGAAPRNAPRSEREGALLQFLLSIGTEQRVRGVLGLRCGFIDDSVDDNSGALRMRIEKQAQEPSKPPPSKKPRNVDVGALVQEMRQRLRSGDSGAVLSLGEKCLSMAPQHAECLLMSATASTLEGRPDEAERLYRRFLELHPRHAQTEVVKGLLSGLEGVDPSR